MRGTRKQVSRFRTKRYRLFAVAVLAAAICGFTALQLWGGSLLGNSGLSEAAAAALETPAPTASASAEPTMPPEVTPEPSAPAPSPSPEATSSPEAPTVAPEKPVVTPEKPAATPVTPTPSPDKATSSGKDKRKLVALTFDDGPDGKYTPQVLDILKKRGVKATFFLVGPQVNKYPKVAKRILDEGHSIGNHTWSHKDVSKLTAKQVADQIDKTQQAIVDATGFTPELMRAPYGSISDTLLDALHERDMLHVYWTVDTRDWAGTPVAFMRKNVLANTRPGAIILMHSFGGRKNALENTTKLLPLIIDDLTKKGFEFVTVDEMIEAGQVHKSVVK
ncbi:polysaccharide deacetylase family protein [Cohnella yongneupensis]|uniref:Polysaccharide deacetylase family protein n=1 Tax=Cohnella yongneupensis TaxID=425006 RepID=A0ABW0QX87_9BACL